MLLTISHAVGPEDGTLLETTIGTAFDAIVDRFPQREALIVRHQNLRLTYRQLQTEVNQCARGLLAFGIQTGERVGVWAPNCAEWTIAQLATAHIGAILVNINPSYRQTELEYALKQSGCSLLISASRFKTSDYVGMIRLCRRDQLPLLRQIVILDDEPRPDMNHWPQLMQASQQVPPEHLTRVQATLRPTDAINIQYTSGTTGYPKGATLSHRNILNNGFQVARRMNFTEQDRLVIPVPLYHCFGMVMGNLGCLTHGATMIYPSPSFDAEAVLEAIQAERATALFGVPTMFIAELGHPNFERYDLTSLRTGVMAGAPCPIELMRQVISRMHIPEIEIAYGMTETSPVSTQTCIDTPLEKRVGTVGLVHPNLEIKIIDPASGQTQPIGISGEFCTRGYSVMIGYWNDSEATGRSIDGEGWMHSGDLATMDAEGYVKIVGRIKDMIIRGGENVYPREIEEFLFTHPAVRDAQVIGVPDARYGEEIMAWIRLQENTTCSAEELREFCRGKIAHFKIPRYVKFVDAFPMTVTGKVQKFVMRQLSIEELGLSEVGKIATA